LKASRHLIRNLLRLNQYICSYNSLSRGGARELLALLYLFVCMSYIAGVQDERALYLDPHEVQMVKLHPYLYLFSMKEHL